MSSARLLARCPAPVAPLPPQGSAPTLTFSMPRTLTFSMPIDSVVIAHCIPSSFSIARMTCRTWYALAIPRRRGGYHSAGVVLRNMRRIPSPGP